MNSWILVADATNARLFEVSRPSRQNGKTPALRLLRELSHPQSRLKVHDLVTDARGRSRNPTGKSRRSAMEQRTNPKIAEEQQFARELAGVLGDAREQDAFAALALVAPPKFAGMLRSNFDRKLDRRIVATIEKDYANLPERDLGGRLSETIRLLRARSEEASTPLVRTNESPRRPRTARS